MGKSYYILIVAALAVAGCRSTANRVKDAANAEVSKVEKIVDPKKEMTAPLEEATILPSAEGVVNLVLIDGSRQAIIRKNAGEKVFIDFPVDGYKHLHAVIAPVGTSEANLRISTITLPDGATDGPFGREMRYEIPSSGKIRLEIGESRMQGEKWGGDFTIDVHLTK